MKFKINRRTGKFGKLNVRNENHGDDKVPAADLKVTFAAGKRELDMLCPLQGETKFSDCIYDGKGNLMARYLSPIKNFRKPESVKFAAWDQPTKERDPIEFDGCTVKSIEITLEDKFNLSVSLTIQLHDDPEKHSARLRRLMDTEREFTLEASQEDFFEKEADEDDEQGELEVDQEQDE